MADDSEKWLERQKLNRQSSKENASSPVRSRRREGDDESRKPSSGDLLRRGSEGGAGREGRANPAWSLTQNRDSKRGEYLGSGSSAHPVSTSHESSLDLGTMPGSEEGEGGRSREEGSWVNVLPSEVRPDQTEGDKESLEPVVRALRKAKDETKQQLDASLQENAELRRQIETARARAHEVTESIKVSSQKELEQQKQELRDAKQRHEFEIKRLRDDLEHEIRQKGRERPQDQNSALQDLEAQYQRKMQEQEQTWHRREQEYRRKVAELESYQQQMTRTEFEARAEAERLQEELGQKEMELSIHLQQSIQSGQRQGGGAETQAVGGMPEDMGDTRRLQREVNFKDIEIETLTDQLEKMKKRISVLNEVIQKNAETAKRGLRTGDVDQYTEQVTRLTEQLSTYDTVDREQKRELAKLRQKVESFGEIERQLDSATIQMSQYEAENRSLRQKMTGLELKTASGGIVGGDASEVARLEAELQRLRPLEGEVQQLTKELERSKHYHGLAKDFQLQISALKRELQQKTEVIAQVQSQTPRETTNPAKTEAEMTFLRKQLGTKEEELARLRSERLEPKTSGKPTVDSVTVQELAGQLAQFRKELAAKDREITRLKTERARLEASGSVSDGASSHSQLQSHQFKELHRLLKEKDDKITKLTEQLQQFERTATDLTKIVQHSKDQSRVVMELKEQLERSETERSLLQSQRGPQEVTEVPSAAAPSEIESLQKTKLGLESSLVATKSENQTLMSRNMQIDMQLRQLKATNAQLLAQVTSLREQQQEAAMAAEVARERDHLQQKTLHMQAKLQNLEQDLRQSKQQISHSRDTLREQGREIQRLTAENLEIRNDLEIERVKAVTFQEDFQHERRDRESAHTKVAEMETRYTHQLQTMGEELHRTATELNAHQQSLTNTEAVMQNRTQQARQQLADKEREVGRMNQEIAHLREEVQSKTQQVKQYKKQVDQYRQEMEPLKQQSAILKEQVEYFACQTEEVKKQNIGMRQEIEALRRERDRSAQGRGSPSSAVAAEVQREVARREAFERRAAELERENDCFRQDVRALHMENDQLRRRLGFDPGRQDPPPRSALGPPPSSNLAPPPRSPPMVHSASVESSQRLGQTYPPVVDSHTRQAQRQLPPKGYSFDEQRMPQSRVSSTNQLPAPTRSATVRPTGVNTYYSHTQPPAPNGFSSRGALPPTNQGPWTPSIRGNFNGQAPLYHHAGPSRNEGLGPMGAHSSGLSSLPSGLGTNEYQQMSTPRYHDDSNIYPSQDTVEKDSPPTSNVSSLAQQLQQQQLQKQVAMAANSGRSNASHAQRRNHEVPSNAHPHLPLGQRPPLEHQPLSSTTHYKPQAPVIHAKAGVTSPILTYGDQSITQRPVAQASKFPVQETQPIVQVSRLQPSMRTTYTFGSSQPVISNATVAPATATQSRVNSNQESNSLLEGIDSEIHQAAKNVKTKAGDDSSLPASGDDVPFDPNLVCPVCRVQFRLGEIQKFRKHVKICHKTKK